MSYVLVADADANRTAACVEKLSALGAGARTAKSVEEAIATFRNHGAPSLLVVDLALPLEGGLAVVKALSALSSLSTLSTGGRPQTAIVAWAASRGIREFARRQLEGTDAHIVSGGARVQMLQGILERLLHRGRTIPFGLAPASPTHSAAHDPINDLSQKTRQLCGTAGVAVYLRAAGETRFRASVSWTSDAPIPNIPAWMPAVFSAVLDSGRPMIMPDLTIEPSEKMAEPASQDGVGGIVAVPVLAASGAPGDVAGMICVFDIKPLGLGARQIDALRALGGQVAAGPAAPADLPADDDLDGQESLSSEMPATVLDRRGGATAIQRELARARRERRQLSVVLFDIDPLPSPATALDDGDSRLATAGKALSRGIRESDLAIRWGQEELLVVLPGLGEEEARLVAERVRAAMQAGARDAAVAGGVAELLPNEPFESVVVRANAKVRLARERGHNRVA
jgi:diguanylate cyclase (GGDEF)-like protein